MSKQEPVLIGLLLLGFLVVLSNPVDSYAREVAGYVEGLSGKTDKVLILREGELLEFGLFTEVLVQDKIRVDAPSTKITVRLLDQSSLVVTSDDGIVEIVSRSEGVSVASNILDWARAYSEELTNKDPTETVSLSTRGASEEAWPADLLFTFSGEITHVNASRKTVEVDWVRGIPPFSISLFQKTGESIPLKRDWRVASAFVSCVERDTSSTFLKQHRVFTVELDLRDLVPNVYTLQIVDKMGNVASRDLKISMKFSDFLFETRQLVPTFGSSGADLQRIRDSLRCEAIYN